MSKILIVRDFQGFFHQALTDSQSLDYKIIAEELKQAGYVVDFSDYNSLANQGILHSIAKCFVWFTSSQVPDYKRFIDDIAFTLAKKCHLIPSYELFRCHDNKVFQELLCRSLDIPRPRTWVFGSLPEVEAQLDNMTYPVVVKLPDGFGSSGVQEAAGPAEVRNVFLKLQSKAQLPDSRLIRSFFLRKHQFKQGLSLGRVVIQEKINDLTHDWKVLVFGDRFYALRRGFHAGDFRASGSGVRAFDLPPSNLLSFAHHCRHQLGSPFLSLDIAEKNGRFWLLEFQATHFGPFTQVYSEYYFQRANNGEWVRLQKTNSLEQDYALALCQDLAVRNSTPLKK
jgi:hypothetical protein